MKTAFNFIVHVRNQYTTLCLRIKLDYYAPGIETLSQFYWWRRVKSRIKYIFDQWSWPYLDDLGVRSHDMAKNTPLLGMSL